MYALDKAVKKLEYSEKRKLNFILSSGFGNSDKVIAFVHAEEQLEVQLFETLSVGQIYTFLDLKIATSDIV